MNLNQITLTVSNIAEGAAFYRKLGCLQIVDSEHYARFESPEGDATFSLHLDPGVNSSGAVIYFEVDNVDDCVRQLQARGIQFDGLPEDKRWLWREATTQDPSGNAVKIYHAGENRRHPPWRIEKQEI